MARLVHGDRCKWHVVDAGGQPRHRGRRRAQGRRAHADGAGDPRRRPLSFPEFLDAFNDLITRARDNSLTADDLQGANLSLRTRDCTPIACAAACERPGYDVATGAIGFLPAWRTSQAPRR